MIQWEYQITYHELPSSPSEKAEEIIACDQSGRCFVHDASKEGVQWLTQLFQTKGLDGWELIQSGYHNRELLCVWKRRIEPGTNG